MILTNPINEKNRSIQYIGYWNNEQNQYPSFPFPKEQEKRDISKDIQKIDQLFKLARPLYTKGMSTCRCCNKINSSVEYELQLSKNEFVIISGGYKHYIEEHFIELDPMIDIALAHFNK